MYIYYTFISNLSIDKSKKCVNYYAFLDAIRGNFFFQNRLIMKNAISERILSDRERIRSKKNLPIEKNAVTLVFFFSLCYNRSEKCPLAKKTKGQKYDKIRL